MMVNDQEFLGLISPVLGRNLNANQIQAIEPRLNECLFVVAGPGSGKTTVLALRVLKFIFVDDVPPEAILATTFTRKAAKELRSRILAWGDQLRLAISQLPSLSPANRTRLNKLDLNAIITGTLDSIAESELTKHRAPGTQPPAVIEDFVANALMLRRGLFPFRRYEDQNLRRYISLLRGGEYGLNPGEISRIAKQMTERLHHDSVNLDTYLNSEVECTVCEHHPHPGVSVMCDSIRDYSNALQEQGIVDFAQLENRFLEELQNGTLADHFTNDIRVVLVDEYQDTNLLQEQIYFELGRRILPHGGGMTVVGDDDQSLYRFRGATVDLFQSFRRRFNQQFDRYARTIFLTDNYRSTQNIVNFCNQFIQNDHSYQSVRVEEKPEIIYAGPVQHNVPVIGLFRDDIRTLSIDLAQFIHQIFYGDAGYDVQGVGRIQRHSQGSIGDCALLCHSPAEVRSDRERLPLTLRQALEAQNPSAYVFNPRGQDLSLISDVEVLCGLILECIDPNGTFQEAVGNLPREAVNTFNRWRRRAQRYIIQNPLPQDRNNLPNFVYSWQQRQPQVQTGWPNEFHLANLAYELVTWIPNMQDDVEGLVYLEVIIRTINESARFSNFASYIDFRAERLQPSIQAALWGVFMPIAMGSVEVDEDLLETLPRDRLNILSVHQSKGLEFPIVIVDVGSDFRSNHWTQAFLRYPRSGNLTHKLEDELRQFSTDLARPERAGVDRAFDDLIRQYFVAFSRAEDVLVLVGLDGVRDGIQNVATGWDRDGNWRWEERLPNLVHI